MAVLVTWREVTGRQPSLEELQASLKSYRLHSVLLGLSRLSAMLKTWQNDIDFALDSQLTFRYLPTLAPSVQQVRRAGSNRLVFTRLSILFVAKHACIVCELDGNEISSSEDVERILSCCLMANDLLLGRIPAGNDGTLEKAASLLPFSDYVPHDSYPKDLARSLFLFDEIAPALSTRADFIDLAAEFQACLGVTPEQFCEFAFCASIKFITNVPEQLADPANALILTPQYFRHTTLPPAQVSALLRRLALSESDLQSEARAKETLGADFVTFQQYPFVAFDDDRYLCPDPGFLLDKAGRSLYWALHFGFKAARRPGLMSFWGAVFEQYVKWLFEQSYQGRGHFEPSPRFGNGDEAFDAYLLEGSSLLLLEFKASVLSIQAKYGFSPPDLRQELSAKVIEGTEKKRKGLAQLRASLVRFLDGDAIAGLDRRAVKNIYPTLVFLDPSFVAPYLNRFYNENFERTTLRKAYRRCTITPAFSLTIGDLESVLPHTQAHGLCEILDSYWHEKRNMYGSLSVSSVPLLRDRLRGRDPVGDRFSRFGDDLERRLFPQGSKGRRADVEP